MKQSLLGKSDDSISYFLVHVCSPRRITSNESSKITNHFFLSQIKQSQLYSVTYWLYYGEEILKYGNRFIYIWLVCRFILKVWQNCGEFVSIISFFFKYVYPLLRYKFWHNYYTWTSFNRSVFLFHENPVNMFLEFS